MISLTDWFWKYGQRPLLFIGALVFVTALVYLGKAQADDQGTRQRSLKQLSELVGLALAQKNRTLVESLLEATHWQLDARTATLTEGGNEVLSTQSPISNELFWNVRSVPVPGFAGYEIRLDLPVVYLRAGFIFLILLGGSVVGACSLVVSRMRKYFVRDVLVPIQSGIDAGSAVSILELDRIKEKQAEANRLKLESEVSRAILKRNRQIARDIRSPLSALLVLTDATAKLPERDRNLFRSAMGRIREIANRLDDAGRVKQSRSQRQLEVHALAPIIEAIVAEKQIEYRNRSTVTLSADLTGSYGLFCLCDPAEFRTALSNLINNAVEAIGAEGKVVLRLLAQGNKVTLQIKDNGAGMPPAVLARLGEEGATFGKVQGRGLGIYQAKEAIEAAHGHLKIASLVGVGTEVSIVLPTAEPPRWFLQTLEIPTVGKTVILDDDMSIHEMWKHRLGDCDGVSLVHCLDAPSLRNVLAGSDNLPDLFLVDYELVGEKGSGLDLLIELGIVSKSVLVTSHHEDKELQVRCSKPELRVLPKAWLASVPISRRSPSPQRTEPSEPSKPIPTPYGHA